MGCYHAVSGFCALWLAVLLSSISINPKPSMRCPEFRDVGLDEGL